MKLTKNYHNGIISSHKEHNASSNIFKIGKGSSLELQGEDDLRKELFLIFYYFRWDTEQWEENNLKIQYEEKLLDSYFLLHIEFLNLIQLVLSKLFFHAIWRGVCCHTTCNEYFASNWTSIFGPIWNSISRRYWTIAHYKDS